MFMAHQENYVHDSMKITFFQQDRPRPHTDNVMLDYLNILNLEIGSLKTGIPVL